MVSAIGEPLPGRLECPLEGLTVLRAELRGEILQQWCDDLLSAKSKGRTVPEAWRSPLRAYLQPQHLFHVHHFTTDADFTWRISTSSHGLLALRSSTNSTSPIALGHQSVSAFPVILANLVRLRPRYSTDAKELPPCDDLLSLLTWCRMAGQQITVVEKLQGDWQRLLVAGNIHGAWVLSTTPTDPLALRLASPASLWTDFCRIAPPAQSPPIR